MQTETGQNGFGNYLPETLAAKQSILAELDSPIPRDVVSLRDAGRGMKLSYLEGWYVIDRLNKVLGIGNWAYHSEVNKVYEGTTENKSGTSFAASYIARVRLVVKIGDTTTEFSDYGYGDGSDRGHPGKAHELAVKEAVTDAIKRCAKNLGMSMGLALYDKTQENVKEAEEETRFSRDEVASSKIATKPRPNSSGGNLESVLKRISLTSRALIEKGKASQGELQALLNDYGAKTKEELNSEQANKLLTKLKEKLDA